MKVKSIIALIILYWVIRLGLLSPLPQTWDEVDFILGVKEFDLINMQPHFPGYPFFMLGGMVFNHFISSPEWALLLFIQVVCISTIYPQYKLSRTYFSNEKSWLLTLALQTLAYPTFMSSLPMSEGAALSVLWWYLWSLHQAWQQNKREAVLWPILFFSVLLGIRLSYLPFGVGLLLLMVKRFQYDRSIQELLSHVALILVSQLIWVTALIANVGSLKTFVDVATGFTGGHFNEWGGGVSEKTDILPRFAIYVFQNIVWNGYVATSVILLISTIILVPILLRTSLFPKTFPILLFSSVWGSYFIWGFFAQNIDKPRHILPLIVLGSFVGYVVIVKQQSKWATYLLILHILIQGVVGLNLLFEHKYSTPAVYQLVEKLKKEEQPILVYTWEETRVMDYLNVPFSHKRVFTYQEFLRDISMHPTETIYVTGAVIEGFKQQGTTNLEGQFKEVQRFSSLSLRDPVYSAITLYQWKSE
ncbi:hypothetical protein [Bacillus sp. 2205SS5-2]|uniref:hypothetical protein n=1 Tax=Bacillus sp. 2205SS5-2 TaxID=3109031 RepID=UPI00300762F3